MIVLSVLAFALALSIDGFGAGVVYGMREIKIPPFALLIVGVASFVAVGISMCAGHLAAKFVPIVLAQVIGAIILTLMGLRMVVQTILMGHDQQDAGVRVEHRMLVNFKIKSLGLVIRILQEPIVADIDKSGHINFQEAILLSVALAVDAMVAGFGASMAGYRYIITPFVVGPVSALCVATGVKIGRKYVHLSTEKLALLPGIILIILGLLRIVKI